VRQPEAFAFAAIPARFVLERSRWAEAAALSLHPTAYAWDRFPQAEAVLVFGRGYGAARAGDVTAARQEAERLLALRDALVEQKQPYWAEQAEIQREIVLAWAARTDGRDQDALAGLHAAADREDATDKHPVTPGPIAPARELLGELLLELNAPAKAHTPTASGQRSSGRATTSRSPERPAGARPGMCRQVDTAVSI
jgi:hypothetical protein